MRVVGLPNRIRAVALGAGSACALTSGGAVLCWGDNEAGQLGNGKTANSPRPVSVTGLAGGVSAISVGVIFACALMNGGAVKCWGNNVAGELGNGSTTGSAVPVDVAGL
jgi:alpha-tubulin suppressor-like RCC1 family protein